MPTADFTQSSALSEKFLLGQSRALREIGGRPIERKGNNPQVRAGGPRQLIDRGAAGGEIRHHLRRHLGRIGGDAAPGHAMIAGKHQNFDPLQSRRRAALPMREPADELFQPAQAARRLSQLHFAPGDFSARRGIAARQIETGGAKRRK